MKNHTFLFELVDLLLMQIPAEALTLSYCNIFDSYRHSFKMVFVDNTCCLLEKQI